VLSLPLVDTCTHQAKTKDYNSPLKHAMNAKVDPNGPTIKHLTFAIVPECDILLTLHGVEAGEPF
jgi:hypothetical protein